MSEPEAHGLRLLVFDGGDIRCLSQLKILAEFLYRVAWKRKDTKPLLACDYFDMIGGVGPAGLIVVLLVILRMTVEDAMNEFEQMWLLVFADDSLKPVKRSSKLKKALQDLFRRHNMSPNQRLLSTRDNGGKGFICAVPSQSVSSCWKLRTYPSSERGFDITVIDAVLASCATPDRFDPLKVIPSGCTSPGGRIGQEHEAQEFISAESTFPNPTREAIKELHAVYGADRRVACVLSLGCGRPAVVTSSSLDIANPGAVKTMAILQAECTAEGLEAQISKSQVYFRFSVDRGLESPESVSLRNLGAIEAHTRTYLRQTLTGYALESCIVAAEHTGLATTKDIYCSSTASSAATYGLPPLSASFVMRQGLLDSMSHALFGLEDGTRRIMVLSGMGGSGKTQIVAKFARVYAFRFRHIFFVDASTVENIKNGILSRVRSLEKACTTFEDALVFLEHPDRIAHPCLLILDNVDDPIINLADVLPRCDHGFIIVTTRNPTQGNLSPNAHIKVDVMSPDEAIEAFTRAAFSPPAHVSEQDRAHCEAIVVELGYLPVAIIQAGSFIKQRKCIGKYLDYLKTNRRKILSTRAMAQLDTHHHAVYSTLDITLQVLSQRARQILGLLACFNYTGFPLDLVERAANRGFRFEPRDLVERPPEFEDTVNALTGIFCPDGVWNEIDFEDVLVELEEYSLVVRVENYSLKTLRFHPLVHAWMFDRITAASAQQYQAAALRLLVCGTAEEDEDLHEQLIPQLPPLSSTWENCHDNDLAGVARLITYEGKIERAVELWEKIVNNTTEKHGEEHLRTYRAKYQLAIVEEQLLSWGSRKLNIHNIYKHYMAILPPDDPERLEAITYYHGVDSWVGDGDLKLQHDVVETLWKRDGVNLSFLTLKAMEVLAKMYQTYKQLDKAIDLLSTILHHREILHGPNHILTLKAEESLLFLKSKRDGLSLRPGDPKYDEMAKQVEDLVMQRMSLQGPDHPGTFNAQASLAEFYEDHDQHHLALPIHQAIVKGWTRRNGIHNFNTIRAGEMLAELHEKLGNTEDAVTHWRQVVEGYWETGTFYDHDLERAVLSLARVYMTAEHYDDEVALWDHVLNDLKEEEDLGDDLFGEVVTGMTSLARRFENLDRHDDAVAQWKRVIKVAMISYDYDTCQHVKSLAELFHRLGRDDDAVAQYKGAVKWTMDARRDYKLLDNLEFLARQLEELGRYDKVVFVWKKFIQKLDTREYCYGGIDNPMRPLAEALDKMGRYEEAAIQWERAFKWKDYRNGKGEEDRLFEMESAANAYEKAGLMDKAEAIRERRKKWEEHWRSVCEMWERGEDVEIDLDILGADQEEDEEDGDEEE